MAGSVEQPLRVEAFWDHGVAVWVAYSDDIPGLATEAETMEALITKLGIVGPELLELNVGRHGAASQQPPPFELTARRRFASQALGNG
jgi:hypothetical protein